MKRAFDRLPKARVAPVLKGRTFRCAVEVFYSCHPEPASAGEGSALPGFAVVPPLCI